MKHVHRDAAVAAMLAVAAGLLSAGCSGKHSAEATLPGGSSSLRAVEPSAVVYMGGDILTMVGSEPQYVEALVVRDGKIVTVGTRAEAMAQAGPTPQTVDLAGKTLLPGFIDAHGHIVAYVGT